MTDRFYTPSNIALETFSGISGTPNLAADFAVGDGSLLKNLPIIPAYVVGLDLDELAIINLKKHNPSWELKTGDFLNPNQETREWLSRFYGKVDLIAMNPPFSCKGNRRVRLQIGERVYTCRPSLAFLYRALKFLNIQGVLIAIMPLSTIKSEADAEVLKLISESCDISFGRKFSRGAFKECTPNSVVFTIRRKISPEEIKQSYEPCYDYRFSTELMRGSTPMFTSLDAGLYQILHTTNLRNQGVEGAFRFSNSVVKRATGNYLCLPRVGRPTKEKIVLVQAESFVLSDCIIAAKCKSIDNTLVVRDIILDNWPAFEKLYESTCAPYITLKQLTTFFNSFSIDSEIVDCFDHTDNLNEENYNQFQPESVDDCLIEIY